MKLLADLHTHSTNSRFKHGKSSIEEMAIEANEVGLVEIGVTDHGYQHLFRTSKEKLKEARIEKAVAAKRQSQLTDKIESM